MACRTRQHHACGDRRRPGERQVHHVHTAAVLAWVGTAATLTAEDYPCIDDMVDHIQSAPSGWLVSMHGTLGPLSAVAHPRIMLDALVAALGTSAAVSGGLVLVPNHPPVARASACHCMHMIRRRVLSFEDGSSLWRRLTDCHGDKRQRCGATRHQGHAGESSRAESRHDRGPKSLPLRWSSCAGGQDSKPRDLPALICESAFPTE
jgi:hypothetical protein